MRHQNETEEQAEGGNLFDVSLDGEENLPEEQDWDDYDPMNHEDFDFDMSALQAGGSHRDEFHFIPNTPELPEDGVEGEDGPGPQTAANRIQSAALHYSKVLDDDEDDRTIIWTKNAGDIIHRVIPPKYMPEEENTAIGASNFAPFASELDWKVAQWAVMDGPGHNTFDRLLAIPGVVEKLGLSYKNIRVLHQKLDNIPEKAGEWQTKHLFFKDKPSETFTIRFRDPIAAIQSLWKDPHFSKDMVYAPAKIFSGEKSGGNRIFSEMWTGKWWHVLQSMLPLGATVAPVIIATDKTQLTQFSGNKSAYPVYLTIGNIPKATRRKPSKHACVLIAYLSVDKLDRSKMNDQQHRSRVQRIFHDSMRIVLQPLIDAGQKGVEMVSADGAVRKVHPILTCYVADYPEQCLVTCTKYGTCVKCKAPAIELGNKEPHERRTQEWTKSILQESNQRANGNPNSFHNFCMSYDVAGS
ncbi:hypothetical protein CVT25_013764, partial [Psilocybe cyanescens]